MTLDDYGTPERDTVRYIRPLELALERMKEILFRPFEIGKWFVIGFGCWLANLMSGGGSGGGGQNFKFDGTDDAEGAMLLASRQLEQVENWIEPALAGIAIWMILALVAFILLLIPVMLWLSSRGEFIFLDNVIRNRAAIKDPWREYRREGNSLFLWRIVFFIITVVAFVAVFLPVILGAVTAGESGALGGLVFSLVMMVPLIVIVIYISFLLRAFVVPIQLKHRLTTTEAWRYFWPQLRANIGAYLLFGLFVLMLWIVTGISILIAGIATCCILFIPLILPYIGTVVLLPVYITFRALSLEFLRQFGGEFDLLGVGAEEVAEIF